MALTEHYAVVVTTINHPTSAMLEIQRGVHQLGAKFIVIGDSKSPADFELHGANYLDIAAQHGSGFQFAKLCPERHYARKNVGYLLAAKTGAEVVVETDDDNIPRSGFWTPRERHQDGFLVENKGWVNTYRYFTEQNVWPRGLPLNEVNTPVPAFDLLRQVTANCPIQQGLADENPDVDAIYRLILPLPISFEIDRRIILGEGVWCPFNSQNTTIWRDAFPLLYLPYYCSFRMTDIWRSFVAQRLMWSAGWNLMFDRSTVYQERNEHDLMRDFADEVPGYLNNDRIRKTLEDLNFAGGKDNLFDDLITAYEALIELGVVGQEERHLLRAWCDDLGAII